MATFSDSFEIPEDYVKTDESCYVEPVVQTDDFDYADIEANGLNLGDCLQDINVAMTGPIGAGVAGFFTDLGGTATVLITSSEPFDIVLDFTSFATNEPLHLNTTPNSVDLNGVGVSVGENGYHNNNSNTPFSATYLNVTEISISMRSNAGTGSGVIFNTVTQRRETKVQTYKNRFDLDLADIVLAGCLPTNMAPIPAVPVDWTLCADDDFAPQLVRLGPIEDRVFRWLQLDGLYHDSDGNKFTRDQTIASGYVADHGIICDRPVIEYTPFENVTIAQGDVGHPVDVGNIDLDAGDVNGAIAQKVVEFTGPNGINYSGLVQVEAIGTALTASLNTTASNFGFSGPSDAEVTLKALPDFTGNIPTVRWIFRPGSANGGENITVSIADGHTVPIDYIPGGGTANFTQADWDNQTGGFANIATTGFVWSNGNSGVNSAFLFEGTEISFRVNASSGLGVGGPIYLQAGPDPDNFYACDVINTLREQVDTLLATPAPSGTSVLFGGQVSGNMNENGGIAGITATIPPANGWSLNADQISFTGSPVSVDINFNIRMVGVTGQRPSPAIRLQKKNGAAGTYQDFTVTDEYVRGVAGDNEGTLKLGITDVSPGVDPFYRLLTVQDGTVGNAANATPALSPISLRAWV